MDVSDSTVRSDDAAAGVVRIDYPPRVRQRWGGASAGCDAVDRLLEANVDRMERFVGEAARLAGPVVAEIRAEADASDPAPRWRQRWMPASDGVSIMAAVRGAAFGVEPASYVEIGSGHSTRFARAAITAGEQATRLISIDPQPRAEVDAICDRVIRERLEDVDLAEFDVVSSGDVVFFDGSHRCLQNSDVTVFFLEVVPRLPTGVLVGVHDIFWPADYPRSFEGRWYSEQYVLAAYLIGLGDRARIHMSTGGLSGSQRDRLLSSVPSETQAQMFNRGGASLWFETVR